MNTDPVRLLDGGELTPDERRALGADQVSTSPVGAKGAIWAALSLKLAAPATAAAAALSSSAPATASGASAVATASSITAVALVKSATLGVALGAAVGTGLFFGARSEAPRPAATVVGNRGVGDLGATGVRAPFHVASEARVKIAWTITNLDDKEHAVELLVDPWNEFIRYRPSVQVVNEDVTTPDYSGFDKFVIVPPKSRVQGELTPDDVVELAVDLATAQIVMSKAGNDPNVDANALINHAFNLQNRSNQPDPLIAPYLPGGAVPGVIGFDLGLRFTATDTQQTAPNVAVEALVDVEDLQGDRVTPPGDTSNQLNVPSRELVPPKPSTMN